MELKNYGTARKYEPILPGPGDWPVVQLSRHRKQFVKEVTDQSIERIKEMTKSPSALMEELETVLFKERMRIRESLWKVDPPDEVSFWKEIKHQLLELSIKESAGPQEEDEILRRIVNRYAEEIAGDFKPSHYRMARSIATFGFARLLNASRGKKFGAFWSKQLTLQDKIHINGEIEQLRELAKKGTLVLVPTHFSNLDSILIGWVIYTLGLPPFIYGAGLNLFNISIIAYFMNSLGAYKVDRRKKNMVYLETLKAYSALALEKGAQSLFFPGGTRSRSGKIEKNLKLGLLGTAVEAQRFNYANGNNRKIFVVPVSLNYHFVLEAPSLIREYLERKGQERYYVDNDEFSSSYKILTFLFKFFTQGSDISVSIGQPMDVLGNLVNSEGRSIDKHGRMIHTHDYFKSNGEITVNKQREEEYTRMLSEKIVDQYHRIHRVFSSNLVAFVAFELFKNQHRKLDLYTLLRLPDEDQVIDYKTFKESCQRVKDKIFERVSEGRMSVAGHMHQDIDTIIKHGLHNVGMYHSKRPLIKDGEGNITTMDLNTLYYYHNRLIGYGLEKHV